MIWIRGGSLRLRWSAAKVAGISSVSPLHASWTSFFWKAPASDQPYLIQVAFEMDDFYEALDHFALLLFISIPSLLLCAAAGGYWISTLALAPVDQITQTARTIAADFTARS